MIRVILPSHLQILAQLGAAEVQIDLDGTVTQRLVLDALEDRYPVLRGALRDQITRKRRPLVRFFVCREDWSHQPPDTPLPEAVMTGTEPFLIVAAIAGG